MQSTKLVYKTTMLILACSILLASCSDKKGGKKDKDKDKKPLAVNALVVKPSKLEDEVSLNGTLLANEQVELKAEAQGKIIVLNLVEGSSVRKGALLAKLNDADLLATLKRQKAQEAQQSNDERRKKALLAVNGISQQDYEQAKTSLDAIRADIQMTQAQIAKTEIRAPFDGTVGLRAVSLGAFVSQSNTIAKLIQTHPLKVEFNLPERYSMVVKKGQTIGFTVEGDNSEYKAKIYAIEPEIDPMTRAVKVRGLASNAKNILLPGSYIKVNIQLEGGNALLVPAEAIVPQLGSQNLYVAKGGKAMLTKVKTGYRTGTQVEIIEGIAQGDTVITTGLMMLKDEKPVNVTVK
ncbi:efflux RND transporter periplasmic adaptor subunit [uncultured Acetobacteroides sp.]|uniref:efflux RND transporter periplasmic adaptor subunit n=1 Tax=uncultured Acetobacteroides sp. TaxID=1760811 RepID=UPI0029F4BCEA|nr:efflux RND transporter periplasmic adaptor subunit [uncultured Acetobacteroides sp.]